MKEESEDMYEDASLFGDFMFRLRTLYGWSRRYVAEKLGYNSESSIMNFETGHTVMRPAAISKFCRITPNDLNVPTLFAMFENDSLKPPCKCICHHDMGRVIPNIYYNKKDEDESEDEGGNGGTKCRLCNHGEGDCGIVNGLWFEKTNEG